MIRYQEVKESNLHNDNECQISSETEMAKSRRTVLSRELRADRRKRIADYVKENQCDAKTASKHFGVSIATVKVSCKEHRVELISKTTGRRPVKPKTFEILGDLIIGKESMVEIAERYGISKQAVDSIRKRAEPTIRACNRVCKNQHLEDIDQFKIAFELLRGEYSVAGIAEELNVPKKMVQRVKKRLDETGIEDLFREHGRKALHVSGGTTLRIAKLLQDGMNVSDVAEITDTTTESIRQVQTRAKKAGLL